jgi:DNA-binding transcriptional ArsR family regulator
LTTPPPQVLVKLLTNATRRAILRIVLAEEDPISPVELSKRLNDGLSSVNYHVRVLERDNGLTLDHIEDGRNGLKTFYVSGPLVKAFPEFVNAALTAEGGDPF